MKIREIRAFAIKDTIAGGIYRAAADPDRPAPRRPPWTRDAEVANPMSRYPRHKALRASWQSKYPAVGCVVIADDGSFGFGTTSFGDPVISLINDHLGMRLVDENPLATEKLYDTMVRMASAYSPAGLASYAISAIDLALWDLKGKLLKLPVYELAGGPVRDDVFCYATGNDTDWHMELGFKATKLACPYGPADGLAALDGNEKLVADTRALIGGDIDLMLDCWMAFDVEFAVRLGERLRPYRLRWMEDCLMPENLPAHAALRERLPWQGLATGEHWYVPTTFAEAAARRYVDIFQPDINWAGGFSGLRRIAHIAEAAGIEIIPHAGMNTPYGQHFTFATPNANWGEYFVGGGPGVPLKATTAYPGVAVPENGRLVPGDAPGFGLDVSLDAIDALRL
jgi:L-rhamnonate dehydratase